MNPKDCQTLCVWVKSWVFGQAWKVIRWSIHDNEEQRSHPPSSSIRYTYQRVEMHTQSCDSVSSQPKKKKKKLTFSWGLDHIEPSNFQKLNPWNLLFSDTRLYIWKDWRRYIFFLGSGYGNARIKGKVKPKGSMEARFVFTS